MSDTSWTETVGAGQLCDPQQQIALSLPRKVPQRRVDFALELAASLSGRLPMPGGGQTLVLWDVLSRVAAYDLTVARTLEPHVDALAILSEARLARTGLDLSEIGADGRSTWGVFAAEGPDGRLTAREIAGEWVLDGVKPWCSLAGRLSHALVTAWTSETTRQLFAVALGPDVVPRTDAWASRGLIEIPSAPAEFKGVRAAPVGGEGWYLVRPGFWWGGIGVAACWYGGVAGVARRLAPKPGSRRVPDQIAHLQLGQADTLLYAVRAALGEAASCVDDAGQDHGEVLARRARALTRSTVDEVLAITARACGPAPLTLEEEHSRRVADLSVYVRQDHGERDLAALGAALLASGPGS